MSAIKQNKKFTATAALILSAVGAAATLPQAGASFWLNLVHHAFLAATVGGMADWFAVTAIFKKPLGISYRTDILRRNRERITESVAIFAADDLLSAKNIMSVVEEENTAQLMVDYLKERGGRERVKSLIEGALLKLAATTDTKKAAKILAPLVREGVRRIAKDGEFVKNLALIPAEGDYRRLVIKKIAECARDVYFDEAIQTYLLHSVTAMRREYEADSIGRTFVLSSVGLDDEKILALINDKVTKEIDGVIAGEGQTYETISCEFSALLAGAWSGFDAAAFVEEKLRGDALEEYLAGVLQNILTGESQFWVEDLTAFIDRKIEEFAADKNMQRKFDVMVKKFIADETEKHHDALPAMIKERFAKWSDNELTEFVETRVDDDLQMIRINGSAVGAIVGMALYALVCGVEKVCGVS